MKIEGRLEEVEKGHVCGWAWCPSRPTDRLPVTVTIAGRPVAGGVAALPRPSLAAAGIGDGAYGFRVRLPPDALADPSQLQSLAVTAGPQKARLSRSPAFTAKLTVRPAAGAARPVTGPNGTATRAGARSSLGDRIALALIVLSGVTLIWTRLIPLSTSLWGDELYSVIKYISPGPSGIWGSYAPKDHVLFEVLSWATVSLFGLHGNDAYRLWSFVPGLAAVAVMVWWLARRLDLWCAAIFAVLAAASPVHLALTYEGRGYGLGFLASVLLVIGGAMLGDERATRGGIVFAAGALIGVWTLPPFIVPVIVVAGVALCFRVPGRPVLLIVAGVVAASLAFYAPVLGGILSHSSQQFGARLPWYGFISGPLLDQVVPSLSLLLTPGFSGQLPASLAPVSAAHTGLAIAAAAILVLGTLALWHRRERLLAAILTATPVVSYLVYEVARFYVEPRFGSFLLLPMLALGSVGLVGAGRLVVRAIPRASSAVVLVCLAVSVFALVRIGKLGEFDARVPLENTQTASDIAAGTGFSEPIVTNTDRPQGFDYYLGTHHFSPLPSFDLARLTCDRDPGFVYLEFGVPPPEPGCLLARHAVQVAIPEQDPKALKLWFVPSSLPGS